MGDVKAESERVRRRRESAEKECGERGQLFDQYLYHSVYIDPGNINVCV
jgi:hypothetical protein